MPLSNRSDSLVRDWHSSRPGRGAAVFDKRELERTYETWAGISAYRLNLQKPEVPSVCQSLRLRALQKTG